MEAIGLDFPTRGALKRSHASNYCLFSTKTESIQARKHFTEEKKSPEKLGSSVPKIPSGKVGVRQGLELMCTSFNP